MLGQFAHSERSCRTDFKNAMQNSYSNKLITEDYYVVVIMAMMILVDIC